MVSRKLTISEVFPYNGDQKECELILRNVVNPLCTKHSCGDAITMRIHPFTGQTGDITVQSINLSVTEGRIDISVTITHIPYEGYVVKFLEYVEEQYRKQEKEYLHMVDLVAIMKESGRVP